MGLAVTVRPGGLQHVARVGRERVAIERATRVRQLFGGHLKQAGIVAGPALVALDEAEHVGKDAEKAAVLAEKLATIPSLGVTEPETNRVYVDVAETGLTASAFVEKCTERGVLVEPFGEHTVRFVTHRDVSLDDMTTASREVENVVTEQP